MNGVAAHPVRLKAVEDAVKGKPRNEETAEMAGELAIQGAQPLQHNGYKIPLMRNLVKRAIRGVEEAKWALIEWAKSPWGQDVPIHIAFFLIWVSAIAGLVFFIGHAIWLRYFAKPEEYRGRRHAARCGGPLSDEDRHGIRWPRALFHWVMAASMFTLLITAFLPKVGV